MNNDPNLTLCGRMADKTVKLTFGQWEYRKEITVVVHGNTRGMSVLRAAVGFAYDELPTDEGHAADVPYLEMTKPDGNTLRVDDEEEDGEDWLEEMLIAAEIVDIKPEASAESANAELCDGGAKKQ